MGKAKKRSFKLGQHDRFNDLSREEAIQEVVNGLNENPKDVYDLITLFGLSAEELTEAGAQYEDVLGLGNLVK